MFVSIQSANIVEYNENTELKSLIESLPLDKKILSNL